MLEVGQKLSLPLFGGKAHIVKRISTKLFTTFHVKQKTGLLEWFYNSPPVDLLKK